MESRRRSYVVVIVITAAVLLAVAGAVAYLRERGGNQPGAPSEPAEPETTMSPGVILPGTR